MSEDICAKKDLMPKSNVWLNEFAKNVTSQGGEDGIIEKILEVIGQRNNWCVEFGSWDGKKLSNTYNLIANKGYSAVLIEGDPKRFKDLLKTFEDKNKVTLINTYVGFEADNNLDEILKKTPIPKNFDLLSIDVDGNDYHIWEATKEYRAKVVVIEFNQTIHPEVEFVQARDMRVTQGSSILSLVKLAKTKGYELVACTSNAFFVDTKYFKLFGIKDNSIEEIWKGRSEITYIFCGYDGRVFLRGCRMLPWQQIAYKESKVQQLPYWAQKRAKGGNPISRKLGKFYRRLRKKT